MALSCFSCAKACMGCYSPAQLPPTGKSCSLDLLWSLPRDLASPVSGGSIAEAGTGLPTSLWPGRFLQTGRHLQQASKEQASLFLGVCRGVGGDKDPQAPLPGGLSSWKALFFLHLSHPLTPFQAQLISSSRAANCLGLWGREGCPVVSQPRLRQLPFLDGMFWCSRRFCGSPG